MTGPGTGWTMRRQETRSGFRSFEVFISPDGVEYIRTPSPELAELTITAWRCKGLQPMYLKRLSDTTAHLRKDEAA